MVFAFNTDAFAKGEKDDSKSPPPPPPKVEEPKEYQQEFCNRTGICTSELSDPDQADNERDVADSGSKGTTSAAQESDY